MQKKLAIIASHPIQYYSPWFKYLTASQELDLRVFYLWNTALSAPQDDGFKMKIQWDTPLLDGYDYDFVPNTSKDPGTHHFFGLINPELLSRIKHFKPDAVLLMGYKYASLCDFIMRWGQHRAPLLFRGDSHLIIKPSFLKKMTEDPLKRWIFLKFSGFLYVGKANLEYYGYYGVPREKLFYSPHAVDNERFFMQSETASDQAEQWKMELDIPEDHFVILFAGKYEHKKRPLDLLKAFLNINSSNVTMLFVGSGILEKELRHFSSNNPNIKFAPFQNQTLMPRAYAASDVFVLPSYGPYETWGLVINEAMCMGKPVIVSTHVGCAADLVKQHVNGLIFKAGDVQDLTRCLQEALLSREKLKLWGVASRHIISQYSYYECTLGLKKALNYVV